MSTTYVETCSRQGQDMEQPCFDEVMEIFTALYKFISSLYDVFGKDSKLCSYYMLLSDTTMSNRRSIKNHVENFRAYLQKNRDKIFSGGEGVDVFHFNTSLSVDIPTFLKSQYRATILQHLQFITRIVFYNEYEHTNLLI